MSDPNLRILLASAAPDATLIGRARAVYPHTLIHPVGITYDAHRRLESEAGETRDHDDGSTTYYGSGWTVHGMPVDD
jgi:hypothetical protein